MASALVVIGVGAALPIWTAWYFSPWEGLGRPAPLWEAVGRVPATRREAPNQFWRLQERNLVFGLALVLVSAGVGWGTYRVMTRRGSSEEARDFVEGPAGSLPDGRTAQWLAPDSRPLK
jgi:hypothetical protein